MCARLEAEHGAPPPPFVTGLFEQLLLESVGYLADDPRRSEAFDALRGLTGLSPERIRSTPPADLEAACRIGGIHPALRAERLQTIAQTVLTQFGGDLSPILSLPLKQAVKALARFPSAGKPGAEKMLIFAGARLLFTLEFNGLRTLLRLGYGEESGDYARNYRSVLSALQGTYPLNCTWLIGAHQILRRHGQTVCRRSSPLCWRCPLVDACQYARMMPKQI